MTSDPRLEAVEIPSPGATEVDETGAQAVVVAVAGELIVVVVVTVTVRGAVEETAEQDVVGFGIAVVVEQPGTGVDDGIDTVTVEQMGDGVDDGLATKEVYDRGCIA